MSLNKERASLTGSDDEQDFGKGSRSHVPAVERHDPSILQPPSVIVIITRITHLIGHRRGGALDEPDAIPEANLAELGRGDLCEVPEVVLGEEKVCIERREYVERGKLGDVADGSCN